MSTLLTSPMPQTAALDHDWLAQMPVPLFGPSLGLLGLHLLVESNTTLARAPHLSMFCLASGGLALLMALGLQLARWRWRTAAFVRDMLSPGLAPFLGQIGIALLLLAEAAPRVMPAVAGPAFVCGAAVSVAAALWWIARVGATGMRLAHVTPGWLVPPIAFLYVALLAPTLGWELLAGPALFAGLAGSSEQ